MRVSALRAIVLAVALAALVCVPAHAASTVGQAQTGTVPNVLPPPDPVTPRIFRPPSQTVPPPTFRVSAVEAVRIADRTSAVREARGRHPNLRSIAYISPLALPQGSFYHWDIIYSAGGRNRVEVELDPSGRLLQITKPPDIGWPLLLGAPGVLGGKLNAPYIWLPLCLLFLLPFIDPRRPFRLLHLDLLVLLGFGISHYFFAAGNPDVSVPLVYPFLLYVVVRAALAAFRPRLRAGPLMPLIETRLLVAGLVVLLAFRIGFGITSSATFDISSAGVIGADRIEHSLPLYQDNDAHGDTYGAVNYLMYIPAEAVFPYTPQRGIGDAARAATLSFDLLVVLGLFLLGRNLRPGRPGTRLGLAFAWAWTAYPYTALVIASNTNDALVPLFVIYALIALRSPPARGLLAGLATMVKFAPGLLAPALLVGRGPFRLRPVLIAGACWAAVCAAMVLLFLPDGGLREFWNTTLGFQLHRTSPLSLWTRHPGIDFIKPVIAGLTVAFAIAAAFVPRRRTVGQVAALCAAILAASQLATSYWLYFYLVWFTPFLLVALFEEHHDLGPAMESAQASETSDFVKPVKMSQPESVTATRSSIRTPSTPGR